MNIRWILVGLNLFVVATLVGLAFSLLGPIHLVRVLGLVAALCGGAGIALHATALHRTDPKRFSRWTHRIASLVGPVKGPATARMAAPHSTVAA